MASRRLWMSAVDTHELRRSAHVAGHIRRGRPKLGRAHSPQPFPCPGSWLAAHQAADFGVRRDLQVLSVM